MAETRTPVRVVLYVCAVSALALAIGVWCGLETDRWPTQIFFAVLFMVARELRLRLSATSVTVLSVSGIIGVVSLPLLGPYAALSALAALLLPGKRSTPLLRRVFNTSSSAIAIFAGGLVYTGLGGPVQTSLMSVPVGPALFALAVSMVVLFGVNIALLGMILRIDHDVPLRSTLRLLVTRAMLGQLVFAFVGYMVAQLWLGTLGPPAALLLLLPIVVGQLAIIQGEAEQKVHEATLRTLAQALETKDPYTRGHGERVGEGVTQLAVRLGWSPERADKIGAAGLLHDVGKIAVPTRIIRKAGSLDPSEVEAVQLHPLRGVELVREIGFLDDALEGIRHHHERFDGNGYPSGLVGRAIPEFARVIAVVDAYDSMTTARTYRDPFERDEALAELRRGRGTQFDPVPVDAFLELMDGGSWAPARPQLPTPREPAAPPSVPNPDRPAGSAPSVPPAHPRRP
jgi:hypothetical protein